MVQVANTNAQAMAGLAALLPQAPEAVQQEFINLVAARMQQHAEDIASNASEIIRIETLIPTISENLTPEQVQQVLNAIPEIPQRIRIFHPNGTELDPNSTLDTLVKLSAQTVTAILEAQRTSEGYVSQATLQLSDGSTKTITFHRVAAADIATYTGQMADGEGGLANAFEFKLSIAHVQNSFLGIDMSYDSSDIREMRTFVTGFAYQFNALAANLAVQLLPPDDAYTAIGPQYQRQNGFVFDTTGLYRIRAVWTQSVGNQAVEIRADGDLISTLVMPDVGTQDESIYLDIPAGVSLAITTSSPQIAQINWFTIRVEVQAETPDTL